MKVNGSCFCGQLKYEADVNPDMVGICHCRDCQILGGSAFRAVAAVPPEELRFTGGRPKYFEKIGDSGDSRRMAFCPECGTHIGSLPDEKGQVPWVSLRIATADQFDQLPPRIELFCKSTVAWLPNLSNAVQFDGMPTG
ncbi:MAG: hypothetical protein ACI8RN_003087 [Glaciecola sp.]|jgi:hypothetical protein|uniref:GFA family protein n=1 Tax=Congregibacter sp. TaxID=2744308 RepID=UPI0039E408E1